VGGTIFYRIRRWQTKTGSSNNFASFSDNNVIPNLKITPISRHQHLTGVTMQRIFYANMAAEPEVL